MRTSGFRSTANSPSSPNPLHERRSRRRPVLVPIGDEQIAKHQHLIDLFANAKVIPNKPKAADYFDNQFNGALAGTN